MRKAFLIISITLVIILSVFASYVVITKETPSEIIETKILKNISDRKVDITRYTIYGTHLNLFGNLDLGENNLVTSTNSQIALILEDESNYEESINFTYEITNNVLNFFTSKNINKGINLEKIKNGNFTFYIKITDNVSALSTYYRLNNTTEYGDLEYYTLTKNNTNNHIKLNWKDETLNLSCAPCKLPENVYDIVIDQGHGGESTGAIGNGYVESEVNYEYGLKLKESLEALGLKVLITRDDPNETVGNYNDDGRAVIPNKVKAKYCFSIHNNSSNYSTSSGVEIYAPNEADLSLAISLADNIVSIANTVYSRNTIGYVQDGVYVLTFDQATIDECEYEANRDGYLPYTITEATTLFFMIREVGGMCTYAYIDGRDVKSGNNPYHNSNIACEGYLLELGFINNKQDITNVVNNMDKYVEAITKSIKAHLEL